MTKKKFAEEAKVIPMELQENETVTEKMEKITAAVNQWETVRTLFQCIATELGMPKESNIQPILDKVKECYDEFNKKMKEFQKIKQG